MTDLEAFEACPDLRDCDFSRCPDGTSRGIVVYNDPWTQGAWHGWQAARAYARSAEPVAVVPANIGDQSGCIRWLIDEQLPVGTLLYAAPPVQSAEPVEWSDLIEQRLLTWRQRFVNMNGDQLALDDFMDKRSMEDLIDFVCAAPPAVQDSWEETARQYAENAKYWRERYEATQKQAEPVACPFGCTTQEEHDAHDNNTNVTGPHPMLSATG